MELLRRYLAWRGEGLESLLCWWRELLGFGSIRSPRNALFLRRIQHTNMTIVRQNSQVLDIS
jgi:hypothetical protein